MSEVALVAVEQALEHAVAAAVSAPEVSLLGEIEVACKALCAAPGVDRGCLCKAGMSQYCTAVRVYGDMGLAGSASN